VRELKNVIENMVVNCGKGALEVTDLPSTIQMSPLLIGSTKEPRLTKAEAEIIHIKNILAGAGGNRTHAAKILGITRKTLYNKLKKYGIQ
jgi:transcriptional regulator of acetoin/glycerol metabolism